LGESESAKIALLPLNGLHLPQILLFLPMPQEKLTAEAGWGFIFIFVPAPLKYRP
jgi:hypothetical protein